MGQVLHGSARTTAAVRRAVQASQASLRTLAQRHAINPKTVAKWKKRTHVDDLPMGPKQPHSTVLTPEQEAACVAFRTQTLLSLDDCLYALQSTIPGLMRSSLHRCFQRHGVNRLSDVKGEKPARKKFKTYPIGYFHIDITDVRTEEGKLYLFVAIDRTSKYTYAELLATYGKMDLRFCKFAWPARRAYAGGGPERAGGRMRCQRSSRSHRWSKNWCASSVTSSRMSQRGCTSPST